MSQLTHRQLPLIRTRTLLIGGVALIVAIAIAVAAGVSGGDSTVSDARPGEAPALRTDGGPEESKRGPITRPQEATGGAALRPDGGPEESTRLR